MRIEESSQVSWAKLWQCWKKKRRRSLSAVLGGCALQIIFSMNKLRYVILLAAPPREDSVPFKQELLSFFSHFSRSLLHFISPLFGSHLLVLFH